MSWQPVIDFFITVFVLLMIAILAYCSIRGVGLRELYYEIKEIIEGKAQEATGGLKIYE